MRDLTNQLRQQHERLTASAEAARSETVTVAKQLPEALVTVAGLSSAAGGGGSGSRPGSAAATRPLSPSLSPRAKVRACVHAVASHLLKLTEARMATRPLAAHTTALCSPAPVAE